MRRLVSRLTLAVLVFAACLSATPARAETLRGAVQTRTSAPIAGLTVYLVSREVGRSAPSLTDAEGWFRFLSVPLTSEPYYLEIYWGQDLMYRNLVDVQGDLTLPEPITIGQ